MMKRLRFITMALLLGLLCLINPSADIKANDETIAVNDQLIVFKINDKNYYTQTIGSEDIAVKQMDTAPIIYLDRTFVPVRFLGNALGVDDSNIEWNNTTRTATLKGSNKLDLVIGKKAIVVNNKTEPIDVAPMITNSRTMLPARFVAEGLGFTVDWDADNQLVIVYQGEKPDISAIIAKIKGEKVVKPEEPKIELPVTSEKIKGTPFYQLEAEQIQACLNAPMPNYTSFGFDEMGKSSCNAAFDHWNYRIIELPYKFYTDKSLVYMGGNAAYFRGYIDRNNGQLPMVDLIFQDRGVSILNVDSPVGGYPSVVEKYYFDGRDKIVY